MSCHPHPFLLLRALSPGPQLVHIHARVFYIKLGSGAVGLLQ